jgi:acyl-CoA reductase-like NAD-dependent aldehyde dehydrogenase
MSTPQAGNWIAGKPVQGTSGEVWEVINPVNGHVVSEVSLASPADVSAAVHAAHTVLMLSGRLPLQPRARRRWQP